MTTGEDFRRQIWLRRRIIWDPPPMWLKLKKEQIDKFNKVQLQLNTKIAELEAQKITELTQIVGIS